MHLGFLTVGDRWKRDHMTLCIHQTGIARFPLQDLQVSVFDSTRIDINTSHCPRLLVKLAVFYPLVKACDVLPLLLLPQVVGLQLKVSHQLHGCHFLPTQWHDLKH